MTVNKYLQPLIFDEAPRRLPSYPETPLGFFSYKYIRENPEFSFYDALVKLVEYRLDPVMNTIDNRIDASEIHFDVDQAVGTIALISSVMISFDERQGRQEVYEAREGAEETNIEFGDRSYELVNRPMTCHLEALFDLVDILHEEQVLI